MYYHTVRLLKYRVLEAIYWPKYEEEARENPVYKVLCKSLFVNIFLSTLMH